MVRQNLWNHKAPLHKIQNDGSGVQVVAEGIVPAGAWSEQSISTGKTGNKHLEKTGNKHPGGTGNKHPETTGNKHPREDRE